MPSARPFLAGRCRRHFALAVLLACWAHGPAAVAAGADQPRSASEGVVSKARALTEKLGGSHADHFLVGMGNDGTNSGDDPAYELGINLDLHYHYLVGLSKEGGWPSWNSNPDYAGKRIAEARRHGTIPMFTYYCMAAHGENNLAGSIGNAQYMATYFRDYSQLLATIQASGLPVVVQLEPDFWGFAQQAASAAGGPSKVVANVGASAAQECSREPDNLVGLGRCLISLARSRAPRALVGLHASAWGSKADVLLNTNPKLDIEAEAAKTAAFLRAVGAADGDFISIDFSDRDAGCYEAGYVENGKAICSKRTGVYWDEANVALPNFRQALAWSAAIARDLSIPILWWQLPFGTPSSNTGGKAGYFRDNRVHYIFGHIGEFVAAGGVGAVWGAGAAGQTSVTTDGDAFKRAVNAYLRDPVGLR